jgi:hypothetical protein
MVKAIGVCRNEYSESMDRLYMDEYDKTREGKGDQVPIELRSQHEDDKCR